MSRWTKPPFGIEDFGIPMEGMPDAEWEKFLAEEGLELLAAYRNIEDRKTRRAVLELVKAVSKDVYKLM